MREETQVSLYFCHWKWLALFIVTKFKVFVSIVDKLHITGVMFVFEMFHKKETFVLFLNVMLFVVCF